MDARRACDLLRERLVELEALPRKWNDPTVAEWTPRARLTLERAVGPQHQLVEDLIGVRFVAMDAGADTYWFDAGRDQARAILKAAIYELEELTAPATIASDTAIDQELWKHVQHLVEAEEWSKVASQAAIFVEDRIRTWAGLPETTIGADLMTAVLKPAGGVFPLGITAGEKEGWHQFGRGFAAACRNVDAHRIQTRSDLKPYAIGVLGAGSLLLTQLRFQHGNSFQV